MTTATADPIADIQTNMPQALAELHKAFDLYEDALIHNKVDVLDALFWDSPHTLRYGAKENLNGYDEIKAFRAGRPSVGRLGSAILHGAGHPEWITHCEAEYVEKVVALASDIPALAQIRATLRPQMLDSPLLDEPSFAKSVEQAYQAMFARWLETADTISNE